MYSKYLYIVSFFVSVFLFSCASEDLGSNISVCNKDDVKSPKLISVDDAALLIARDTNTLTIEISKSSEYESGHLPRAINVWRPDFRSKVFTTYQGMICDERELESFLQIIGMTKKSKLLLYDNKGSCDAMRLAWVFDCYNISNYQVINGGKAAWTLGGHALDTALYVPKSNPKYEINTTLNTSLYARRIEVLKALGDQNTVIVDTREPYEFEAKPFIANGKVYSYKKGAYARGAIPGAIHLNWSDLSDLSNDQRIKCPKDLVYNLEMKGITSDKNIIVYCQSGSRSSHTAFVLREILGYPNVKNYDGSWIEWSFYHKNGNEVPIEQMTTDEEFEKLFANLKDKLNNNG